MSMFIVYFSSFMFFSGVSGISSGAAIDQLAAKVYSIDVK